MESQLDQLLDNLNKMNNLNLAEPLIEEDILENSVTEDINIDIPNPKLVMSQSDLIRAINLSSTIIQPKSDNIVYNSLTFISKGSLKIFATNELSHFMYNISTISNSLDLVFSIPLVLIQKLTKLMGNKVMFFIDENKLYIRLLSGDLLLDLRIPNMNLVKLPILDEDITESLEIPVNTLGRITSSILPILSTELRSDFKKISFLGDKAFYLSPFYYIEAIIKTPNMSLRMKDAEFISKLYKFYSDKNLKLSLVKGKINRIQLKMENITYIFISGQAEIEEFTKNQIDSLIKPINIIFNFDRFNKIINLATLLPNSTRRY